MPVPKPASRLPSRSAFTLLACFGLGALLLLPEPAAAQRSARQPEGAGGAAEAEARQCLDQLIRDVPSYRALSDLRERINARGFRVVSKRQEEYDFRGKPVFVYGVRVTGEAEAYRLACVF